MKKLILISCLIGLLLLMTACGAKQETYTDPNGNTFKYKLEIKGTLPNAVGETTFTVLTDNKKLTFERVYKSLLSSNSRDRVGSEFYVIWD